MQKSRSHRRTGLCQSVFVLFVVIVVSSVLNSAVTAQTQSSLAVTFDLCQPPGSPSKYPTTFSPAIIEAESAADKAKSLATEWFRQVLNLPYENAIQKFKWQLINELPKTINKPTDRKVFKSTSIASDKSMLEKLFKDLIVVRDEVVLRGYAADGKSDVAIFEDLLTEIDQVIVEMEFLFPPFKVQLPHTSIPSPKKVSESETDHKYRDWIVFHDFIVLLEFTHDFVEDLQNRHCAIV